MTPTRTSLAPRRASKKPWWKATWFKVPVLLLTAALAAWLALSRGWGPVPAIAVVVLGLALTPVW